MSRPISCACKPECVVCVEVDYPFPYPGVYSTITHRCGGCYFYNHPVLFEPDLQNERMLSLKENS